MEGVPSTNDPLRGKSVVGVVGKNGDLSIEFRLGSYGVPLCIFQIWVTLYQLWGFKYTHL